MKNDENIKSIIVETDKNNYITSITRMANSTQEELDKLPDPEFQDCYKYIDEQFILDEEKYNTKLQNKNRLINNIDIQKQIFELKTELSDGDYKIIKCYEAQLVGKELPYNIEEIYVEREEIRQQINELEKELL